MLNSAQLDAFVALVQERHFGRAATLLHITQSALSQRLKALEDTVGATLFVRRPHRPAELTPAGERLLVYCRAQRQLEDEARAAMGDDTAATLRIAGFSSIMRPIVLPALAPLLGDRLGLDFRVAELYALPDLLIDGAVDYVLATEPVIRNGLRHQRIGTERYVLVRRDTGEVPKVYLDHDPKDRTTVDFLRLQKKRFEPVERRYLDDVFAIADAVQLGLGYAVLPQHMVADLKHVRIERGLSPMDVPVYLSCIALPRPTSLQDAVVSVLAAAF